MTSRSEVYARAAEAFRFFAEVVRFIEAGRRP
jgi:hypothetical protein